MFACLVAVAWEYVAASIWPDPIEIGHIRDRVWMATQTWFVKYNHVTFATGLGWWWGRSLTKSVAEVRNSRLVPIMTLCDSVALCISVGLQQGVSQNTLFCSSAKKVCPKVTIGPNSILIFFQIFWTMGTFPHRALKICPICPISLKLQFFDPIRVLSHCHKTVWYMYHCSSYK